MLKELELVHGVDPFLRRPVGNGPRYFRLHGKPAYRYHYRYSDQELTQLERLVREGETTFVLFNNDRMADDARRFRCRRSRAAQPR